MKKIIISLGVIAVTVVVGIGVTAAYFNDTEASSGNIFTAGDMDLKVDHLWQTYNGVTCNTCDLTLISNQTNMVIKRNGVPVTPYPAVFVGSNGGFIHPAWTAQNDPQLVAAGAKWIWESDPTRQEDTTQEVTYTFEKRFEWYGPIVSSDLWFAIGSDNSIVVTLNGVQIATNPMEKGYQQEHMLHIPAADVNDHIVQGENVLTFEVKNWALAGGTPYSNPAGLIYKFYISGNCQDNFFKQHCQLWGEKDLEDEHFFSLEDVKPGDNGTNIISMHVSGNDAFSCLLVTNPQDNENVMNNSEQKAGDTTGGTLGNGELSQFLSAVLWEDSTHNNVFDQGETVLYGPGTLKDIKTMKSLPLTSTTTAYIGLAWCLGTQTLDGTGIHCSGTGNQDVAQTDSFLASLTAYATQQRNNSDFQCVKAISD